MIIPIDVLKKEFPDKDQDELLRKEKALESSIRKYTNNNFQDRRIRMDGHIEGGVIIGTSSYFGVDDTIMLSESINDELAIISEILDNGIKTVEPIVDEPHCLVTKVVYPPDIAEGVLNLMKWDHGNRSKVGIKSESLSRKSTTYFDLEGEGKTKSGYPTSLMDFLKPYRKPRF